MLTPRQKLAELVAASPAFRSWVGAVTEEQALSSVHQVAAEPPTGDEEADAQDERRWKRPYAFLWSVDEGTKFGRGGYMQSVFALGFEADAPADQTDQTVVDDFERTVGLIVRQILVEQENPGRLMVRSIGVESPTSRTLRQADDFVQAVFRVEAGPEELP